MASLNAGVMELYSLERSPGMEDAVEGFLDSLNLLEDVELGDVDLPICHPDTTQENSDSDSGISISCENTIVDVALDPISSKASTSDCVLTDAIYGIPQVSSSERSPNLCRGLVSNKSKEDHVGFGSVRKPIRIIRLSPRDVSTTSTISLKPTRNVIPLHSIKNPSQPISKHISIVQSNKSGPITSKIRIIDCPFRSNFDGGFVTIKEDFPDTPTGTFNADDGDTYLDRYDPATHMDGTLEKHLHEFCGATFTDPDLSTMSSFTPRTPSYPSPSDSTFNDCILTHASLDRLRKKQERMIKNRHAASMSRLRKKEYLERLELRYEQLKKENINLWRQNEEWRVRCEKLETCLNDLQSHLNEISPSRQMSDISRVSSAIRSPHTSDSSIVATISSTSTSPVVSNPPRSSLSTLNSQGVYEFQDPLPNLATSTDSSRFLSSVSRPDAPVSRKAVINSVFYPGKESASFASGSNLSRRINQTNLIGLTGTVTRHRPSPLQTNRPKLIASTTLLCTFGLFTLNMFLPSLSLAGLRHDVAAAQLQSVSVNGLHSIPRYAVGRRALLNVRVTPVDRSNAGSRSSNNTNNPGAKSNCSANFNDFNSTSKFCLYASLQNTSNDAWQQWVKQQMLTTSDSIWESWHETFNRERLVRSTRWARHGHRQKRTSPQTRTSHLSKAPYHPRLYRSTSRTLDSKNSTFESPKASSTAPPSLQWKRSRETSVERGLQPFYRHVAWDTEDLLETVGRRNDTVYLILARPDAIYLHVGDSVYDKLPSRISLIVPAYPSLNGSHYDRAHHSRLQQTMLQIECELRNVTLIHPPETPAHPQPNADAPYPS